MSKESNPIIRYADSYRDAARKGQKLVDLWSLVTDLERDIAPLFNAAQSELVALREELDNTNKLCDSLERSMKNHRYELGLTQSRLTAAEQRNATLTTLLREGLEEYKTAITGLTELSKPCAINPPNREQARTNTEFCKA